MTQFSFIIPTRNAGLLDLLSTEPLRNEPQALLDEIFSNLPRLCRFHGAMKDDAFFSVAEHSVCVYDIVRKYIDEPLMHFLALGHDFSEAFTTDIPTPVKSKLLVKVGENEYAPFETVEKAFNIKLLDYLLQSQLKQGAFPAPVSLAAHLHYGGGLIEFADKLMLSSEASHYYRDITGDPKISKDPKLCDALPGLPAVYTPRSQSVVRQSLIDTFADVTTALRKKYAMPRTRLYGTTTLLPKMVR